MDVKNDLGLHARPASIIAKLLQKKKSQVQLSYGTQTADGRSIMSILMLGAPKGASIGITVEGEDAEMTMQQLLELFEHKFNEGDPSEA